MSYQASLLKTFRFLTNKRYEWYDPHLFFNNWGVRFIFISSPMIYDYYFQYSSYAFQSQINLQKIFTTNPIKEPLRGFYLSMRLNIRSIFRNVNPKIRPHRINDTRWLNSRKWIINYHIFTMIHESLLCIFYASLNLKIWLNKTKKFIRYLYLFDYSNYNILS